MDLAAHRCTLYPVFIKGAFAARVYWDGGGQWQRIFDFGNGTTYYMMLTPRSGSNTLRFDIDLDGDALAFSKDSGPDWLTVAGNGALAGIPADSDIGENVFAVRVQDPGGLFNTENMIIEVANIYSGAGGLEDLAGLAAWWLFLDCTDIPSCGGADLDSDANVDLSDLAELARNWMPGI